MGVEVIEAGDEGVRIRAPLESNGNHHGTLFGGSASALAILAAWGWMYLELESEGLDPDLVIQRSAMEFLQPGREGVEIICRGTSRASWTRFLRTFRRFGRARLTLCSEIHAGSGVVARMEGDFVALQPGVGGPTGD